MIMGGLTLSKIGYDRYLRFAVPYFLILLVLSMAFMFIGNAIG